MSYEITYCEACQEYYTTQEQCPSCVAKAQSHESARKPRLQVVDSTRPPKPKSMGKSGVVLDYPIVEQGVSIWYIRQRKPKNPLKPPTITAYYYDNQWFSILELWFWVTWQATGQPMPTPEHQFSDRRWRFDFAFIDDKIAIELEGGAFSRGRHTRGKGFVEDCEKYNEATRLGWQVYRIPKKDERYIQFLVDVMTQEQAA